MHALPRAPGIDIRLQGGSQIPLSFAAAMVAAVEEPEDDGDDGEPDEYYDQHYYPFPVV